MIEIKVNPFRRFETRFLELLPSKDEVSRSESQIFNVSNKPYNKPLRSKGWAREVKCNDIIFNDSTWDQLSSEWKWR